MNRSSLLKRLGRVTGILGLGLLGAALLSLSLGTQGIPLSQVLGALIHPHQDDTGVRILLELRLPRVLLAALVGASLSLAGAAFQGVLRNPLADPYIVGTSAGAAVGASVAIVAGLGGGLGTVGMAKPFLAFVGALATMYLVYRLAEVDGTLPVEGFLLAGVVVGSFLWAFVSFMLAAARSRMEEIILWLMGDLSSADYAHVGVILPYLVLGAVGLFALSHAMNLLSVGEDSAAHLGISVEKTKMWIIILASLVTASAVSVSGLIGFVGFMVPHGMRSLWGADHRVLLPASALGGAIFLVLADLAARLLLSPAQVPVGVITALLGGPFFFALLRRRHRA